MYSFNIWEEYTTLSSVIPILMELQLHLRDMALIPQIIAVATTLQSELNRRFKNYTDPADEVYEPNSMYIVWTILNPSYEPLINAVQMESGQDELLQMLLCRKKILQGSINDWTTFQEWSRIK